MEVCPLSAAVGEAMLKSWLAAYHRTLTPAQFLTVLEGYAQCPLPLYLKMAFHQALKWASYTPQEVCSWQDLSALFLAQLEPLRGTQNRPLCIVIIVYYAFLSLV